MEIIVTKSYTESCKRAAKMIVAVVNEKKNAKLGLATGSTAVAAYEELKRIYKNGDVDFSDVKTVNLDEYCGLSGEHEQSYRYFMNEKFFNHVNIDKANTFVANGLGNFEENAKELDKMVYDGGTIDLQLLGIGRNGHIAFNEPGESLISCAHVENLTQSTIDANSRFFSTIDEVPTKAITMGLGNIMSAKQIIVIASGAEKADAIKGLVNGNEITTQNPSTMLKMHSNVTLIVDEELAALVGV